MTTNHTIRTLQAMADFITAPKPNIYVHVFTHKGDTYTPEFNLITGGLDEAIDAYHHQNWQGDDSQQYQYTMEMRPDGTWCKRNIEQIIADRADEELTDGELEELAQLSRADDEWKTRHEASHA